MEVNGFRYGDVVMRTDQPENDYSYTIIKLFPNAIVRIERDIPNTNGEMLFTDITTDWIKLLRRLGNETRISYL